ncbi:hypothetical protein DRQ25_00265 [Candidatus Fermentibacteria bacterium]|nr:MAG: hypothetical protein DRQ25_00265 [Candidatus Fermentibacteria bacterium]
MRVRLHEDKGGVYLKAPTDAHKVIVILVNHRNLEGTEFSAEANDGKIYVPECVAKSLDFRAGDTCKLMLR